MFTPRWFSLVFLIGSLALHGTSLPGATRNDSSAVSSSDESVALGAATTWCASRVTADRSGCNEDDARVSSELIRLGTNGAVIGHVRELTLQILESGNGCSAWFEEADPSAADVFRSLHYELNAAGPEFILTSADNFGNLLLKHPWGARSLEDSGRNSFIEINGNGPFFVRKSRVMPLNAFGVIVAPDDLQPVTIGPYVGATAEARVTIMLHELGHIVGRLPKDDNSWNGSSSRNTAEVLRHCKKEIHDIARQDPR